MAAMPPIPTLAPTGSSADPAALGGETGGEVTEGSFVLSVKVGGVNSDRSDGCHCICTTYCMNIGVSMLSMAKRSVKLLVTCFDTIMGTFAASVAVVVVVAKRYPSRPPLSLDGRRRRLSTKPREGRRRRLLRQFQPLLQCSARPSWSCCHARWSEMTGGLAPEDEVPPEEEDLSPAGTELGDPVLSVLMGEASWTGSMC